MSGTVWLRTALFAAAGAGMLLARLFPSEGVETLKGRGKVAKIDPATHSLVVQLDGAGGRIETFHWDTSSRFCNIDGDIGPEDVQVGQRVSIMLENKKGHRVSRVEVDPVYEEGQA